MEKKIFNFVFVVIVFLLLCISITNTTRSNRYRKLCNQYTEQLRAAETTNRELNYRLGRVAEITGRINETANSNVADARGIIETVEKLRTEIQELEDCCGGFNQCEYYLYWDDYFNIE